MVDNITGALDHPFRWVPLILEWPWLGLPIVKRDTHRIDQLQDALALWSHLPEELTIFVVIDVGGAEDSLVVTAGTTFLYLVHVPAHQHAVVTCVAEHAGQGWYGDRLGPKTHHSAGLWKKSGEEAVTCRNAGGHGGVGPAEECTFTSELVELRSGHPSTVEDGECITTPLVRHDQQDVRLGDFRGSFLSTNRYEWVQG